MNQLTFEGSILRYKKIGCGPAQVKACQIAGLIRQVRKRNARVVRCRAGRIMAVAEMVISAGENEEDKKDDE